MKIEVPGGTVSLAWDGPAEAPNVLVLGHGAGIPMTSDYMEYFARGLASDDRAVCRFNFLYAERGKRAPDKQAVLEQTYGRAVEHVRAQSPEHIFIGGKSLGGRIASHVAAGTHEVDGLVFLGYPLHPPGRPDRIRDAHLASIAAPMLFVEGTRDPFCPLDTLSEVIARGHLEAEVVVIDDGDHSLKVRKTSGRTTLEAWDEAIVAIDVWLEAILSSP